MKKRRIKWKTIIAAVVSVAGLVIMLMMYSKLREMTNQLVYLQDTTNIILSDVSGMQSNIEKTLKEEASMVEDYSIEITDMDFAGKNYEVKVSVIPKEYSEDTNVSVYFGTVECPLKLEGYVYTGSVKLPLNKSFDGNVTFLLANGKKKSTEVLEDYDGLGMELGSVISGRLEYAPTVKEGNLSLESECSFALDGGKQFQFESLELVALLDDELEDTAVSEDMLKCFGFEDKVIRAVRLLTHVSGDTYDAYLEKLKVSRLAMKIKCADMTDNENLNRLRSPGTRDVQRSAFYHSRRLRMESCLREKKIHKEKA